MDSRNSIKRPVVHLIQLLVLGFFLSEARGTLPSVFFADAAVCLWGQDLNPDAKDVSDPYDCPFPPDPCDPETAGSTFHLAIPTGNIWTKIPILETYAAGDVSLSIELTYNSVFSETSAPEANGWCMGVTCGGGAGGGGGGGGGISFHEIPAEYEIDTDPPEAE